MRKLSLGEGFGKGKGVAKVETTPYYDFSKPVTTYSGDLPLQHTFGPGEQWIGTFNPISLKIPGVRNAYNRVVHPQAYKELEMLKVLKVRIKVQLAFRAVGVTCPNPVTPSNRVFYMGDGKSRQVVDITDPNKLAQTRASREDSIKIQDITITFVCHRYPRSLMRHLKEERGYQITGVEDGIYYIIGDKIPIQMILTKELSEKHNLWLKSLTDDLEGADTVRRLIEQYGEHKENKLYKSVMNLIVRANQDKFKEVKTMCEALGRG